MSIALDASTRPALSFDEGSPFALAFLVVPRPSQDGFALSWRLELAQRRRTRSGSRAPAYALRDCATLQPLAPQAASLVRALLKRPLSDPPALVEVLPWLLAAWPVDLRLDTRSLFMQPRLRLARIEALSLRFIPVDWQAPDLLRFGPRLQIKGRSEGGVDPVTALCEARPEFADGRFLVPDIEHSTLFWSDDVTLLPPSTLRCWSYGGGLLEAEVLRLLRSLPRHPRFSVAPPVPAFLKRDPPRPVVRVSATPEPQAATELDLGFRYRDLELHLGSSLKGRLRTDGETSELWLRDHNFESATLKRFESLGFTLEGADSLRFDGPLAVFVATRLEALLDADFEVWLGKRRVRRAQSRIGARISSGIDWLEFSLLMESPEGAKPFDPDTMDEFGLFRADGAWWRVAPDEAGLVEAYVHSRRVGMTGSASSRIRLNDFAALETLSSYRAFAEQPGLLARRDLGRRLLGREALPPRDPPSDFLATLRPYQQEGLAWLSLLAEAGLGGVLADDMGLGKTVQALALLVRLLDSRTAAQALVVAPLSVLPVWESEARRFAPRLRVLRFHGPSRLAADLDRADLILTSYQTLNRDAERLGSRTYRCLILDEAQQIKNPASRSARCVYALRAESRFALSGTPFENRCMDIWSIFTAVLPGLLGTKAEFCREFETPIHQKDDRVAAARLKSLCAPFLLRRLKTTVLAELPARQVIDLPVTLGGAQAAHYTRLHQALAMRLEAARLAADPLEFSSILLLALLRLRQAAIHPRLVSPEYPQRGSAKLDALDELVSRAVAEGHKILVFSQFTSVLDLVEERLGALRLAWTRLDGSTEDRDARVAAFSSPDGPPIFLISLKAGGVGLNLAAADYVVLLDPWWNHAAEAQAIDRAHRMGQTKPVFVYRIIAIDTIEARVLALQEQKRRLCGLTVGDEDSDIQSLSQEEIMRLFA